MYRKQAPPNAYSRGRVEEESGYNQLNFRDSNYIGQRLLFIHFCFAKGKSKPTVFHALWFQQKQTCSSGLGICIVNSLWWVLPVSKPQFLLLDLAHSPPWPCCHPANLLWDMFATLAYWFLLVWTQSPSRSPKDPLKTNVQVCGLPGRAQGKGRKCSSTRDQFLNSGLQDTLKSYRMWKPVCCSLPGIPTGCLTPGISVS